MRRIPILLLLLVWTALGSGGLAYAHSAEHRHDDAGVADHHDEQTCAVHLAIHSPAVMHTATPVLSDAGLLVVRLPVLSLSVHSLQPTERRDCRGPPAASR